MEKKIKNPEKYLRCKLKKLKKILCFKNKNQEFSILLTNNYKMKKLNNKFRKKNKTTDVISFPLKNIIKNNIYIGDIAISFEIINKRSIISDFKYEFDIISDIFEEIIKQEPTSITNTGNKLESTNDSINPDCWKVKMNKHFFISIILRLKLFCDIFIGIIK